MEDEATALEQLTALVSRYPHITQDIITDVLRQCNQSAKDAVRFLCEMFDLEPIQIQNPIPHDKLTASSSASYHQPQSSLPKRSDSPRNQSMRPSHGPIPVNPNPPTGAWANKTYARRFKIDKLCSRYEWVQREIVENLFDAYGDSEQLVEEKLIQMFPVDEPIAFANTPSDKYNNSQHLRNTRSQQAIAMRNRVESELRLEATKGGPPPLSHQELHTLRQRLWETREYRQQLQILAVQTRKPEHFESVREQDQILNELSQTYLKALKRSEDFRTGILDVHGLTREEAIQLVDWKLEETRSKRFRVITGKGTHSHRGQAVLKPALEKHLRAKGIACSLFEDGILTVNP